ncbi:MAG TPA: septum formation initiator family protein [Bryobacteraceae bacterium]|nr:septum formation initiator family protein [Bryobacteraceae bacterium]
MTTAVRRIAYVVAFLIMAGYGYIALRGPQGIPALMEKWREIRQMEEENANLQRELEYKRERIQKLKNSPSEQEMEIRKKLKLLKPGETEFILPDAGKDSK